MPEQGLEYNLPKVTLIMIESAVSDSIRKASTALTGLYEWGPEHKNKVDAFKAKWERKLIELKKGNQDALDSAWQELLIEAQELHPRGNE